MSEKKKITFSFYLCRKLMINNSYYKKYLRLPLIKALIRDRVGPALIFGK